MSTSNSANDPIDVQKAFDYAQKLKTISDNFHHSFLKDDFTGSDKQIDEMLSAIAKVQPFVKQKLNNEATFQWEATSSGVDSASGGSFFWGAIVGGTVGMIVGALM